MPRPPADSSVFLAIADPTRRAILDRLRDGERAVSQLAAGFAMSAAAVSQHLGILKRAGLVADRRVGRVRFYRLCPEPLAEVETWIAHYRRFWPEKLAALGTYLEALHGEEPGV